MRLFFSATRLAILVFSLAAALLPASPTLAQSEPIDIESRPIRASTQETQATRGSSNTFDVVRILLALGSVIGLIVILRWAYGKATGLDPHAAGRAVRVLTRAPLGPRQQIILLQVGRRLLVVGESGGQLSSLTQLNDPDEIAELVGLIEGDATQSNFKSWLGLARKDFESDQAESLPDPDHADIPAGLIDITDDKPATPEGIDAVQPIRSELSQLLQKVQMISKQMKQ